MVSVIYADCHLWSVTNKTLILSVIMLNAIMLSVVMLSVVAPIM
jgi:hypothetical protein